jgi:predicted nucleic-acid-binding Zn-ribbon protein
MLSDTQVSKILKSFENNAVSLECKVCGSPEMSVERNPIVLDTQDSRQPAPHFETRESSGGVIVVSCPKCGNMLMFRAKTVYAAS